MAQIKSMMMDSLSKVQTKNHGQLKLSKDKNAGDFANCLSASQKGSKVSAKENSSINQKKSNAKVVNSSNYKKSSESVSQLGNKTTSKGLDQSTVNKAAKTITDKVQDTLGVDDDTLANAMTALGFSAFDLLDTNNLAKLVLAINGSNEFTDLLTNENMMEQLNSLIDGVESISINLEEILGMSKDDFTKNMSSIMDVVKTGVSDEKADGLKSQAVSDNDTIQMTDGESGTKTQINVVNEDESGVSEDMSGNINERFSGNDKSLEDSNTQTIRENFMQNLEQAVKDVEQTQQVSKPENMRTQQMVDIVNQVVEKIKVSLGTDSTSMEMQLNPEHLGKVLLNVSSKDGMMTAVFSVQSEEAKAALESQMFTLRENLELRELKVDAVEVNVSDFDFSRSDQAMGDGQSKADNGNGKQTRFEFDDDESDDIAISNEEKEAVRKQVMRDNGSQVDFTA